MILMGKLVEYRNIRSCRINNIDMFCWKGGSSVGCELNSTFAVFRLHGWL